MRLEQMYEVPMTDSIFPKVEELLEDTEYQKALNYVSQRKNTKKYRSMVDFLLCELFVHFKEPCLMFYNEQGLPLRDRGLPDERLKEIEDRMVRALKTAKCWMEEARKAVWHRFVEDV